MASVKILVAAPLLLCMSFILSGCGSSSSEGESTSAPSAASWGKLKGGHVQYNVSVDTVPDECFPGEGQNPFTEVPLSCCTARFGEPLYIAVGQPYPFETSDDAPCHGLPAFGPTTFLLAGCKEGVSYYGEGCDAPENATEQEREDNKCYCEFVANSTSQPACFRVGDFPDSPIRWFSYMEGC
mmetsp:Transcript_39288/g.70858  ORF Transcript_39288/g.70858 Transcript_39288/m.70858 type:complete len:183 (-) Transcript_39288:200-748(-)